MINAMDFGALADGVTDDLPAFQRAVAALTANGGGELLVPPGRYRLHCAIAGQRYLRLPAHCLVLLDGAILDVQVTPGAWAYYVFLAAADDIAIQGGVFNLDRNSPTLQDGHGCAVRIGGVAAGVTLRDLHINDAWGDGIYIGGSAPVTDIDLARLHIHNSRRNGIAITHARGVRISDSTFSGTHGLPPQDGVDAEPNAGTFVEGLTIERCTFDDNGGSGLALRSGIGGRTAGRAAVRGVRVVDCTARGNTTNYNLSVVDDVALARCHSKHAKRIGIALTNGVGCAITNNISTDNGGRGLYVEGATRCQIAGNICTGNAGDGLYLRGHGPQGIEDCQIADNISTGNAGKGLVYRDGQGSALTGNIPEGDQ